MAVLGLNRNVRRKETPSGSPYSDGDRPASHGNMLTNPPVTPIGAPSRPDYFPTASVHHNMLGTFADDYVWPRQGPNYEYQKRQTYEAYPNHVPDPSQFYRGDVAAWDKLDEDIDALREGRYSQAQYEGGAKSTYLEALQRHLAAIMSRAANAGSSSIDHNEQAFWDLFDYYKRNGNP